MNFPEKYRFLSGISSLNEDILVQKLLLSHDPDGRWLDSEMLLQEVENIMCFILEDEVPGLRWNSETENTINDIEVDRSDETLPYAISRITLQMLCPRNGKQDIQTRTMVLFDLVENYRWDAKVVLVLGALAATYGRLWLTKHLNSSNPLAASVATLNRLPRNTSKLSPNLKSLSSLVKAMVDVTKYIIKFERLPVKHAKLGNKIVGETMSQIYLAAYWVVRSALACLLQISNFKQPQQASETKIAAWELSSLGFRLNNILIPLTSQVEECHQQIEKEIYQKLCNIFMETHDDNQEVLQLLFSLADDLPLKDLSRQIAISELKNKVTLLLVSKPELLPFEPLLFLLQQTYDHPSKNSTERNYEIIWVPIPSSAKWTDKEKGIFEFFSNSLAWCSVRRPWLMSSTVVKFIRTEWNYRDDEPIMVVLDSSGKVVNMNAMDMVFIWSARAYPFSVSKEDELWEEDGWSMQLLVYGIHPMFNKWMEEGREICIYGSDDLDWADEFKSRARKIQNLGFQFELVYLGKRNPDERTRTISSAMNDGSVSFSFTKLQFFWFRLERIRRSKLQLGKKPETDCVLLEVSELLDFDYDKHKGWAVIGQGSAAAKADILRLEGEKLTECLQRILRWGEKVAELGFAGAVKIAGEADFEPCDQTHTCVVPFEEGPKRRVVTCEKCKRPMQKFIVYQ